MSEVTSSSAPNLPSNVAAAVKSALATKKKELAKPGSTGIEKKAEKPVQKAAAVANTDGKATANEKKLQPTQLATDQQMDPTQNVSTDKKEATGPSKSASTEPGPELQIKEAIEEMSQSEQLKSARAPDSTLKLFVTMEKDEAEGKDGKKKRKWYQFKWTSIGLSVCLSVSLIDPNQLDLLAEYSRANGGLYFLLLYFAVVWFVQMPLTFLFIHWGQYTQVGLTKITTLFGQCFRGIGWAMFFWLLVNQAVTLNNGAERFDHALTMGPLLDDFVSCRMKDVDCFTNNFLSGCCISLAALRKCRDDPTSDQCYQKDFPSPMTQRLYYEKEEDNKFRPTITHGAYDRIQLPPSEVYWKSESLKTSATFGKWRSPIMTLTIIICAILAATGSTIFTIIFSCLGLLAYIFIFVNCSYLIHKGQLSVGIQRIVALTEPERLFTRSSLFAICSVVFIPVNFKFFTVSIARLRTKRSEAFATAVMITIVHLLVNLFFLMANLSMTGWLEKEANDLDAPTSITAIAGKMFRRRSEYWRNFLPEFFSLANLKGFYTWFCFCHFLMHIFPILGSFFSILELKRSHPTFARDINPIYLNVMASCGYGGTILLLGTLFQLYPNVVGRHYAWGIYIGCTLLLLFCHVTVQFYGADELYIDLCFVYPITKTFHDYYGPLSKSFRWLLRVLCPLVLVVVTTLQLDNKFDFDRDTDEATRSRFFELVLPGIGYYTLCTFLGLDLGQIVAMCFKENRRREIWKLIYPTEEHPSHLRIIKDHRKDQQMPKTINETSAVD